MLELVTPVTLAEIKIRYKILVKQLHPDANGGDKTAEERLKTINLGLWPPSRSARMVLSDAVGADHHSES